MDVTCLVFYACLFGNVARANFTHEFLFVTAMLAQTCYVSNSTTLLQPCWHRLVTAGLNNLVPNCYRPCYNLVPTAPLNAVNNLLQACQSNLSTTSANTT